MTGDIQIKFKLKKISKTGWLIVMYVYQRTILVYDTMRFLSIFYPSLNLTGLGNIKRKVFMIYYTCRKSRMEQETQLHIVSIDTYLDYFKMAKSMAQVNQSELSLGIYSLEYNHNWNWNCKEEGVFIKYCVALKALKLSTCHQRLLSYSIITSFLSKWCFFSFWTVNPLQWK